MVRPLKEYFWAVDASDVHDYGAAHQDRVVDFLWPTAMAPHQVKHGVDWTVTNPAFRLGVQFALTAIERSRCGVALLVRTAFLEGVDRHRTLFEPYPPALILQFTERVIMHKGVLRDPAKKYWDEATQSWKTPSSATSYCWIVWLRPPVPQRSWRGTRFDWLAPCRKRLERPGDYDNGGAA